MSFIHLKMINFYLLSYKQLDKKNELCINLFHVHASAHTETISLSSWNLAKPYTCVNTFFLREHVQIPNMGI